MARRLRLEFDGACYHVLNRGNYRSHIFADDGARQAFLDCLDEVCAKTGWVVHAWCIMVNHYHLALETPQPNLVDGMRWLQSTFATRFNRFRRENGHLFQGRYKGLLIDPFAALGPLCHYIHLNPMRAGVTPLEALSQWPWSSLRWVAQPKERPRWFNPDAALQHAGGLVDTAAGRRRYIEYLGWLAEDRLAQKQLSFERMSRGWVVGARDFKTGLIKEHGRAAAALERGDVEVAEVRESVRQGRLDELLAACGRTRADLARERKSAPWKVALAAALKSTTTATNRWLGEQLHMGNLYEVSRLVARWQRTPEAGRRQNLEADTNHKARPFSPT